MSCSAIPGDCTQERPLCPLGGSNPSCRKTQRRPFRLYSSVFMFRNSVIIIDISSAEKSPVNIRDQVKEHIEKTLSYYHQACRLLSYQMLTSPPPICLSPKKKKKKGYTQPIFFFFLSKEIHLPWNGRVQKRIRYYPQPGKRCSRPKPATRCVMAPRTDRG